MPGPGGGGRSGGGGRGGSFGGGGGGGFGGGGRGGGGPRGGGFPGGPPPRPHPRPFMGWGRRYYGGGGCLGGLVGMILLPVVLIILLVALIFGGLFNGVNTVYDEEDFQDYAYDRYMQYFGSEKDYEDQLLMLVLVEDDEYYAYNFIAFTGNDIHNSIRNMLGGNGTQLGALMAQNISENYKYSLSSNLATVFDSLTVKVTDLKLDSSFTCTTEHGTPRAELVNESTLNMSQPTVETALNNFATETGISVVLLVVNQDEVLPTSYTGLIVSLVLIAAIVIIVILLISKKKKPTDDSDRYQPNGRY